MHQGLLSFFIPEFTADSAFIRKDDEKNYPFMILLKNFIDKEDEDGDELAIIWTEVLRIMSNMPSFNHKFSPGNRHQIELLAEATTMGYN